MKKINQLLKEYNHKNFIKAKKLNFLGMQGYNIYNITDSFKINKISYIFGRVEPSNFKGFVPSKVLLFKKKKNSNFWVRDEKFKELNLEDPFYTKINNLFVMGGVEVKKNNQNLKYRIIFYRGKNIYHLKKFAKGPFGMKDIRLIQLNSKEIGVFTRPEGKKAGRGKIGFTIIKSLNEINPHTLSNAEIITGQFFDMEIGGVNKALILKNNKIGVLGHIAQKDKQGNSYYPIVFCFDPYTKEKSDLKIILRRKDIPKGIAKNSKLCNVIFPGGIIRENKGIAKLYVGASDAESYEIIIKDPFLIYEKN
jgi:predicted GH43/DUF377 family glycosyl hydrolase